MLHCSDKVAWTFFCIGLLDGRAVFLAYPGAILGSLGAVLGASAGPWEPLGEVPGGSV